MAERSEAYTEDRGNEKVKTIIVIETAEELFNFSNRIRSMS